MTIRDIMPGVKLIIINGSSILFGAPPEVVKYLMVLNDPFPEFIVIPDIIYKKGIVQNSTEFPLYYYLFEMGAVNSGRKLGLIGHTESLENNRKLLDLTLFGPTIQQYKSIGLSDYFDQLYKESQFLAPKNKNGDFSTIDDFIKLHPFTNGEVELDLCTIKHEDTNIYSINGNKIDIRIHDIQLPPYNVSIDYTSRIPFKFGIDVLGGGSGFTPHKPCSALMLNYNSEFMLIDCMPYLEYSLKARGVSRRQIKSLFLSHIHDDHCNMSPLLEFNDKIKFLGTKEIYWMAMEKLALQTNSESSEFHSFFDFFELFPYKDNDFYGMTIVPHYTVHSIPTIGAIFSMKYGDTKKNLCFVGDNSSLDKVNTMVEDKIISKNKAAYLTNLYHKQFNLLFPDGGMGILHGTPEDSIQSKSDSVVFMHLENLPPKFGATFSRALAGKRYNLIESIQHIYHSYTIQAMQMIQKSFPGISYDWLTAMLNDVRFIRCNIDDIIIKQGERRKGLIYILLSGRCRVKIHDGEKLLDIAIKEAGDFVGEMAIVSDLEYRTASVVAETPVVLCEIDEKLFYLFLEEEMRLDSTKNMWKIRSEIEKFKPFSEFSDALNERVSLAAKRIEVQEGEVIIQEGDDTTMFYIVMEGSFSISINGEIVNTLKKGGLFGEFASVADILRTATVTALEKSTVLEISKERINDIIFSTPALNFYVHRLIKSRSKKLQDFNVL
jgi:CRP-like cAMP-binding protein